MTRILVTGAAGFIGSRTVGALLDAGHEVIAADRHSLDTAGRLADWRDHACLRYLSGDVADEVFAREVAKGAEAVLHLASLTSVPESFAHPERNRRDTLESTKVVYRASHDATRFVFSSSSAVYPDSETPITEDTPLAPQSPYAVAKADCEEWLREQTGPDVCILRYFNVFGVGQDASSAYSGVIPRFVTSARQGGPIRIDGDGVQTRDFIHLSDVARANVAALTRAEPFAGEPVNVASGSPITIRRLAEVVCELATKRPEIEHGPEREGTIRHSCADVSKMMERLGIRAEVQLEPALRELWERL